MSSAQGQNVQYRFPGRLPGAYPGAHVGQMVSNGLIFKRHAPLIASPDPRRLDLRASILDPFQQSCVRMYRQNTQLTLMLVADMSSSMSFTGQTDKASVMADCLLSIASSAMHAGDKFGFIGCGDHLANRDWRILPGTDVYAGVEQMAGQIRDGRFSGVVDNFRDTFQLLPRSPALIFVLSDFHMQMEGIAEMLRAMHQHFVVPLVLWDRQECCDLPEWGSFRLQDMETGQKRTIFMRPGLKRKIIETFDARRKLLTQLFRSNGSDPVFIDKGYSALQLTQYFYGRANA